MNFIGSDLQTWLPSIKAESIFFGNSTNDSIPSTPIAAKTSEIGKQIRSFAPTTSAPINSHRVTWTPLFNSAKYLLATIAAAALAEALFPISPNIAIATALLACWFFLASAVTLLTPIIEGSDNLGPKLLHWNHATMHEICCIAAMICLLPATFFTDFHQPKGDPHGKPILMINGYLSFGSTWYYLRKRLSVAGCGPIYTMNLGSFRSIADSATQIQSQVKKIQKETGLKEIIFVCHSKGGLVGSYYATKMAESDSAKVTDIVMIGSPLFGTPMAKFAIGKDAAEMEPNHSFLLNLREEMLNHPEIRFFHIASKADLVVPYKSALLGEDRSKQRIFDNLGHLGMLFSSKTADQILSWLKRPLAY